MTGKQKPRKQLSIPFDDGLVDFIERAAAREDRTCASIVRHIVAEAARREREEPPEAA